MPIALNHCSISRSQTQFPIDPTAMFKTLIRHSNSLIKPTNLSSFFRIRSHYSAAIKNSSKISNNLFSRISPLRQSSAVIPVLDQWVEEGRKVQKIELQRIIRDLRSRRRCSQALQVYSHDFFFLIFPSFFNLLLFDIGFILCMLCLGDFGTRKKCRIF